MSTHFHLGFTTTEPMFSDLQGTPTGTTMTTYKCIRSADTLQLFSTMRSHAAVRSMFDYSDDSECWYLKTGIKLGEHIARCSGVATSMRPTKYDGFNHDELDAYDAQDAMHSDWFNSLADLLRDVRELRENGLQTATIYGA